MKLLTILAGFLLSFTLVGQTYTSPFTYYVAQDKFENIERIISVDTSKILIRTKIVDGWDIQNLEVKFMMESPGRDNGPNRIFGCESLEGWKYTIVIPDNTDEGVIELIIPTPTGDEPFCYFLLD